MELKKEVEIPEASPTKIRPHVVEFQEQPRQVP